MDRIIRVLIVDDSAYVRKVIRQMLSRSPFLEVVGIARDGVEALELSEQLNPDVITLDLIMPGLDGLGFLRQQMARRPVPVVVVSIANDGSEMALAALDAGAVDVVQKPTALATEKILEMSDELISKVKAAAQVTLQQPPPAQLPAGRGQQAAGAGRVDIVVIGISTGGPQALKLLIPQLPAELPVPVVVVMHMPVGYTGLYAQRLDELAALKVQEAQQSDSVVAGSVLIAPAGRHFSFHRDALGQVRAHLDARPFDTPHRPAVDVLFRSAAEVFGERVLGVIMTGMGNDGQEGAAWIKAKGGLIFSEAQETCVVYGMPRAVDEAGLSDRRVPLTGLAQAILEVV